MTDDIREHDIILVVDDDQSNLLLAHKILGKEFRIATANSGTAALKYLSQHSPNLILLDINMPGMDGFQVMEKLKDIREIHTVPIICLTADDSVDTEIKCLKNGATDYITKPFIAEVLLSRVRRTLELAHYRENLESMVAVKTKQVERITLQAITAIANTIDAKDEYTKGHSVRVAEYSARIAQELGWNDDEIQNIKYIALLHDIGKIGVPDSVLNKPGRLTDMEFHLIKAHTIIGGEILKDITMIDHVAEGAKHHHEKYDGTGYPEKLKGEEIPVHARIIGIADAYDAMNSNRIYRKKLSGEKILEELQKGSGTQFDPGLLEVFLRLLDCGEISRITYETETGNQQHLIRPNEEDVQEQQNPERDYLTGLLTRKAGEDRILMEIVRQTGALALIDIDNMRQFNDTRGHLTGDYAIRLVSDVLAQQPGTIASRFEGDEFLCFIRDDGGLSVEQKMEAFLHQFQEQKEANTRLEGLSLSVGLCMCRPGDIYENVLKHADRALYYAKQTGKAGYYIYTENRSKECRESSADLLWLLEILQTRRVEDMEDTELSGICNSIHQMWEDSHDPVQLVMLTFQYNGPGDEGSLEKQRQIMQFMNIAICRTVRNTDIFMRFSSDQYLILLKNAKAESIEGLIHRISQAFYKTYTDGDVEIRYDVAEFGGMKDA